MNSWFKEAKYGMMVHWGLYSLLGGEWKGKQTPWESEWIMRNNYIPIKEYEKLTKAFNPVFFDAEEWVLLAKECGMKYFVITSKHHDGFALFHSKVDKYNIVDATPFGRDVIKEIAEACQKHGMRLGIYYSQDLDWHEEHGGGFIMPWAHDGGYSHNVTDFPGTEGKNYTICFEKKIVPQVKELLTNYGDLCLVWFDTPRTIKTEQSRYLFELVKKYQPHCLVNSRIGNGLGDYTSTGDNEIPEEQKDTLYEAPATMNRSWGYKSFDQDWKSSKEIWATKRHLNERGINYLLNVGPDGLGRIPAPCVSILHDVKSYKMF
ncbi:MAG: alpha-L-fucosidase [Ruminococcaceae bacterium]|nr:alpha-L-fucosidase [Oscillospiraceae bacterium]